MAFSLSLTTFLLLFLLLVLLLFLIMLEFLLFQQVRKKERKNSFFLTFFFSQPSSIFSFPTEAHLLLQAPDSFEVPFSPPFGPGSEGGKEKPAYYRGMLLLGLLLLLWLFLLLLVLFDFHSFFLSCSFNHNARCSSVRNPQSYVPNACRFYSFF